MVEPVATLQIHEKLFLLLDFMIKKIEMEQVTQVVTDDVSANFITCELLEVISMIFRVQVSQIALTTY